MASSQPTPDRGERRFEEAVDWERQRSNGDRSAGCGATVVAGLVSAYATTAIVASTDGVAADDLDAGNSAALGGLWFMLPVVVPIAWNR